MTNWIAWIKTTWVIEIKLRSVMRIISSTSYQLEARWGLRSNDFLWIIVLREYWLVK